MCSRVQLSDAWAGMRGGIRGWGVKQGREAHGDHQRALANPKWEVWFGLTPDVAVPVCPPYLELQAAREDCAGAKIQPPGGLEGGGRELSRAVFWDKRKWNPVPHKALLG